MWRINEIIEFSDGYRVDVSMLSKHKIEAINIWVTVKKGKDGKLSIKPADNWELKNKDLQLSLINELKYKLEEEKYENKYS